MNENTIELGGLLMGAGTPYNLVSIDGLGVPAVVSADASLQRRNGQTPGDDFLDGRGLVVVVQVLANRPGEDLDELAGRLQDVLVPGQPEQALTFRIPGKARGGDRCVFGRPRAHADVIGPARQVGVPTIAFEFWATDPRIYDATSSAESVSLLAEDDPGSDFQWVFPVDFGGASPTGGLSVFNAGNFATDPVFRIAGPVTNPIVDNLTTGETFSASIDLVDGDELVVDCGRRTVLLNGSGNRRSSVDGSSRWPTLRPGLNELRFRSGGGAAATLTTEWRSAWAA